VHDDGLFGMDVVQQEDTAVQPADQFIVINLGLAAGFGNGALSPESTRSLSRSACSLPIIQVPALVNPL
jgi:hypothetical protein